ncbi:MAG: hypothetical protein D6B25_02425 [Desulfobulbaceae bacterium]|nr:MAG: hypothetical protein D6B25_02425 [Desulfobulbaceae bacterium]
MMRTIVVAFLLVLGSAVNGYAEFGAENVQVVFSKATGFGMYQVRPDNVYKAGEPIIIYGELKDLSYRENGRKFEFGVDIIGAVEDDSGNILADGIPMGTIEFNSFHMNKEVYLNVTFNLSGVQSGKYTLVTRIKDIVSGKSFDAKTPIEIKP